MAARYAPDLEPVSDVGDDPPADEDPEEQEGEFAQQRNELLGAVTVAEEDLARTREVFEFTKRLARKGYKSLNEVESDRIAVTKARIALSVAREKLGLLDEFSKSRTAEEMLANFVEAVAAQERTSISGKAALEAYQKEHEARVSALEIEQSKHDRLVQQLEACMMYAPADGIVVYANQNNRRSNEQVVIEEQATVRERQAIINLPDLNRMKVDAQVHESRISLLDEDGRRGSFESLDANDDGSLGPTEMPDWTWSALVHADVNDDGALDFSACERAVEFLIGLRQVCIQTRFAGPLLNQPDFRRLLEVAREYVINIPLIAAAARRAALQGGQQPIGFGGRFELDGAEDD